MAGGGGHAGGRRLTFNARSGVWFHSKLQASSDSFEDHRSMSSGAVTALPTQLGGFEIIRRLGAAGMAEVFVAKRQGAKATYKILVLKPIFPAHGTSRRFPSMFVKERLLATRWNRP